MSQLLRLKLAKQRAEALLVEEGLAELPVDPFALAARHEIVVEPKPDVASGVSGMLLRHGDSFGVLYSTDIPSEGFQRFSIAHELGHYFLEGHMDHILPKDGMHASHAGFVSADPFEQEADNFAVGFLMPAGPFKRLMRRHSLGLAGIEAAAESCRTSLTATAIRYAELSDDAVAIIVSTGRTIDYCILSEAMKSLPDLTWLRKGLPVPTQTETARMNATPERVLRSDRATNDMDVLDWLGGKRSVMVTEDVVGLGRYGKTLTVLSSKSIGHEAYADEGDDEAELIEKWTPRFK